MDFKEKLEKHPLWTAVVICATAASAAGGAVFWIMNQRLEVERVRLEAAAENSRADLERRLLSIEKKLDSGESLFDLSKLTLPNAGIASLPATFASYAGGSYYVDVPPGEEWHFRSIEPNAFLMTPSGGKADRPNRMFPLLPTVKADIWYFDKIVAVHTKPRGGDAKADAERELFCPMAAVQVLTEAEVMEFFKNVAAAGAGEKKAERDGLPKGLDISRATMSMGRHLDVLAMLFGVLLPALEASTKDEASFRLVSVQQRPPVLFLETELSYRENAPGHPVRGVEIRNSLLVVRSADRYVIANIVAPTMDGRSLSLPWLTRWLAGVRVPL